MDPGHLYTAVKDYAVLRAIGWLLLLLTVLHVFLCALFGIRMGFMNPFLLKLNRLGFSTRHLTVSVRSIRLKLSLFDLSDIMVAVEGLNVTVHKRDGAPEPAETPRTHRTLHTLEDIQALDPDRPVCILCDSKVLNMLIKIYLLYFRFVGVRFTDAFVSLEEAQTTLHIETFEVKVDLNKNEKKNFAVKSRLIQLKLNDHEILDSCFLDARATLNFDTGHLSGLALNFDTRTIKIRFYTIIKKYINLSFFEKLKSKNSKRQLTEEDILDMIHDRLRVFCNVVRLLESVTVSLQGIQINEIPVVSKELLRCPNYKPLVFVHIKVNSFVAAWERLFLESPGYGLLYDHSDRPFKVVYNFTGVSISMEHIGKSEPREVITVPVMNFNGSSNVFFQTLEAIISRKESKSKFVISGHLSEPTFDMSTDDISVAVMSAIDFLTYIRINETLTEGDESDADNGIHRTLAQKFKVAKNLSKVWPVIELKLGIENPVIMCKSLLNENFHRILLLKLNTLAVELRTSRDIINGVQQFTSTQKLEMHNAQLEFRNTQTGFGQRVLSLEEISIKQELVILPLLRFTTTVHTETTELDLSNLHTLHGMNSIISELDDAIVPHIRDYRRFLNRMETACENGVCEPVEKAVPPDTRSALEIIQDTIPYWIQKADICCDKNTIIVGSRSLLLNKELVKNIDPQTKNDLVNGELRSVELTIERWDATFSKCGDIAGDETPSTASSLEDDDKGLMETLSEATADSDAWVVRFSAYKTFGRVISERSSNKSILHEKVFLKIPTSCIELKPCDIDNRLLLRWNVERVDALYSVITHFILISSLHLVRNTIFEFLLKNPIGEKRRSSGAGFGKKLLAALEVSFAVGFLDVIFIMPDCMKMRIEITDVASTGMLDNPILVGSSFIRLCTESPTVPGYWTRILTSVGGGTRVNIPTIIGGLDGPWLELSNDSCHINSPHCLIIYKIFDNISVMVKTLKQLHHSLKYNSDKIVIVPHAKSATKVPKMKLRSNRLLFSMEDDPFESELNMIFQIGLVEQKMRLEKMASFERRVIDEIQSIKKPPHKAFTDDQLTNLPKPARKRTVKGLPHSHSASTFPTTLPTPNKAKQKHSQLDSIDADSPKQRLHTIHKGFSKSWVSRIKTYKSQLSKNFVESFEFLWGNVDTTQIPEGMNRKVLDFVKFPSLLTLILEGVELDLGPPACGYDGIPDFLFDVGKGIPRDTEYSTLIPVHVELKLTELRAHLRDYPLPLVHMPAISKTQDAQLPAVRIHGDFVIGENMISSNDEVREVYVPLVPGCTEFDEDDCYSIEVPKTLTAIKIYTNLAWDINSELATTVTWGTSYQPCIQQIMLNLDNFTKPPIDPSEKVGFWDKIRANFHARIRFTWLEKSKLHILFKGSMNPYAIGGESSGFMLGFMDSVTLDVNGKENPKEFIASKSNNILFAVPNHLAQPLPVWSKPSSQSVYLWDVTTNFQKSAFGYHLAESTVPDAARLKAMSGTYIEKCVISLTGGVQFNLSFFFERKLEDGLSRSSEFSPHYDIVLRNPKYVKDRDNYDAYSGFRSQFIHMGLSLVSQKEGAYNTIQLTPTAFQYFFAWWKLFSSTLPVRHGRLFGPDRTSKKFSRHLYSIKYQALVEPLFVSHVYHDFELAVADDKKVDCVGVKGRATKFVMDLHQRKELTIEHNANLGITRKNMRMKFNLGKLELEQFDVRILEGFFDKIDTGAADTEEHSHHTFNSFDDDMSWFDMDDFLEIYETPLDEKYRGTVNVYPLMYTPRFLYYKRQSYGDKYQLDVETGKRVEPFGSELFHECLVEGKPSLVTQQELFDQRLAELEDKLEQNAAIIEELHGSGDVVKLKRARQLKIDNEQLRHGIKFVKQLAAALSSSDTADMGNMSSFNFAIDDDPAEDSFSNRFIVHNMMLKWNDHSRDGFYRYIYLFELKGTFSKFKQHKSLGQLDDVIETQRKANYNGEVQHGVSRVTTYESLHSDKKDDDHDDLDDVRASQRMKNFKQELREIAVGFFYKTRDNYLVKLISPQIQLQCEDDRHAAVLITAPKIELDIVTFDAAEADSDYDENIFEQRFGCILEDASIFLFHENEIVTTGKLFFNSSSYGSTTAWPPWLGVELCYDGSLINDHVLMQKTSIMVRYDKVMNLFFGSDDVDVNRMSCDLSQAVLTCDAKQYYSLYTIIMKLLIYNDPRTLKLKQKESKMSLSLDLKDLTAIRKRIITLQEGTRQADGIVENFSSRMAVIDDLEEDDLKLVRHAKFEAALELYLLMRVSVLGSRRSTEESGDYLEWNIRADDIKLHMLDEERNPFLDVILFNSHFMRVEQSDRSDRNHIVIQNLEVINLDNHSNLPVVFSAYHVNKKPKKITREADEEPLIYINWQMDYPVGGIRIMKKFEVALQPIQFSIEEITGEKIIKYAFPNDDLYNEDSDDEDTTTELTRKTSFTSNGTSLTSWKSRSSANTKAKSNGHNVPKIQMNGDSPLHVSNHHIPGTPRTSLSLSRRSRDEKIDNFVMSDDDGDDDDMDQLDEMVQRASKYLSFVSFKLKSTVICITFRGKGSKKLINVTNFVLNLPEVYFSNRTYTLLDLTMHLKKVLVKALLSHTGSIIGNKLSKRGSVEKSLKSLSNYATNRINTFRND